MKVASTIRILALVALTGFASAQTTADPFTGTWTLNVEKSRSPATSQVLTIIVSGDNETYQSVLELPDGRRQVTHYTAPYDGNEHPSKTVVISADGARSEREDTVILVRLDRHTRERHWQQNGRTVRILRRKVSQDERTLTSIAIDVDPQGKQHDAGTMVFDRT